MGYLSPCDIGWVFFLSFSRGRKKNEKLGKEETKLIRYWQFPQVFFSFDSKDFNNSLSESFSRFFSRF